MAKKKDEQNAYALVWKTSVGMHEVVRGPDPAAAMTSAGYGGGALGALDYYVDLGPLQRSKTMKKCILEVADYGDHGYFWKRETCAKLEQLHLVEKFIKHGYPGWKISSLGILVIKELKLEN